jgi:hypothetical protein
MIKYDTYHDTSDQLPHGARTFSDASPGLVVMEADTAGRTKLAEKKKMGPPGPCSGHSCSRYSMSRTMWASRHDLLVIPGYRG